MKLIELINETVGRIIYRWVDPQKAYKTLSENKFILKPSVGANRLHKKFYYLSLSRIKFGGFARTWTHKNGVIFILNGDKFNQRYKGKSVDYFGPELRGPTASIERKLKNNENEERVLSDKNIIPNASSYIKEIHVFDEKNLYKNDIYRKLRNIAQVKEIPIYFYSKLNDFKILNKKKAEKNTNSEIKSSYVKALIDIYNGKYTSKEKYRIERVLNINELVKDIEDEIRDFYDEEYEIIGKLTDIMKKEKIANIKEFIEQIISKKLKWEKK